MIFLNTQTFPDTFGHRYKLHLPDEGVPPRALEPELFEDADAAAGFVDRLEVEDGFWRRLIMSCDDAAQPGSMSDQQIRRRIGRMLVDRRVRVYRVPPSDSDESSPRNRRFSSGNGVHYRFEHASAQLTGEIDEPRRFSNPAEAVRFLSRLNLDDAQLKTLAREVQVSVPSGADATAIQQSVGEAMARQEVIVAVEKDNSAPSGGQVESVAASAADVAEVGLGPAAAGAVAEPTVAEETEPPCDLQRFTVECRHGRTAGIKAGATTKPRLAVVATESAATGKERITAQIQSGALCPRHKSGDFSISREHKAGTKAPKKVVFDAWCAGWSVDNLFERVWLPAVRPKTYTVRAKDTCESPDIEIFDIDIDVYPKMKWHWETTINFGKLEFVPGKAKVQYSDLAIDGNVQLTYDGEEHDGKEEFDRYITKPMEGFQKICDAISKVLEVINNPESLMRIGTRAAAPPPPEGEDNRDGNETRLQIQWPNLTLGYDSELLENSAPHLVDHDYSISVKADPLLDVDLQVDVLDVFMKMAPAGTSALIKYAKERVEKGFESKNAKFSGEIDLIFTAAVRVDINEGALSGTHNIEEHDLSGDPIKGDIKIPVELVGMIKAEGKWFFVDFSFDYELMGKAGWAGEYEIGKDSKGIYISQYIGFTGIVITATQYEEVKASVKSDASGRNNRLNDFDIEMTYEEGNSSGGLGVKDGELEAEATRKIEEQHTWEWLTGFKDTDKETPSKYYLVHR